MHTRRTFLKRSISAAGAALALGSSSFSADRSPTIHVNHVGFTPRGHKLFVLKSMGKLGDFAVVDSQSGNVALRTSPTQVKGDFGVFMVGDFSAVQTPGTYEIRVGEIASARFSVDERIYTRAIQKCISYFSMQRCGDSKTGYNTPCHLDDGQRSDNGEHYDVSGGWHDACDVRKWVDATIYGMMGLSRVLDRAGPERVDRRTVIDELRWGNSYFQKMQEPAGFLMNYCGGDDGNNFTDNKIGTADDRKIHVEPADMVAQFHFIAAQAATIRHTRDEDPQYAQNCEKAAKNCLNWCITKRKPAAATSLAAGVIACVELYRATRDPQALQSVTNFLTSMSALQVPSDGVGNDATSVRGFFLRAPDRLEPVREIQHGNLPLIALAEALTEFPTHPGAPQWRRALELHCDHLESMAQRSAFGIVPFGLYMNHDPGGNRPVGKLWYRWFMKPHDETAAKDWWVGINAHLASHGVGLRQASQLLNRPQLAHLAQRQLDWIMGANPFDVSTITDVGRNQPQLYRTGQFRPSTPLIPGGVMNGIGGSDVDEPVLQPGSWQTCEYWTPMVAYTMWLMAELENA